MKFKLRNKVFRKDDAKRKIGTVIDIAGEWLLISWDEKDESDVRHCNELELYGDHISEAEKKEFAKLWDEMADDD